VLRRADQVIKESKKPNGDPRIELNSPSMKKRSELFYSLGFSA